MSKTRMIICRSVKRSKKLAAGLGAAGVGLEGLSSVVEVIRILLLDVRHAMRAGSACEVRRQEPAILGSARYPAARFAEAGATSSVGA